ncbi:helix-turn-helix domain-containing protein [Paenibacillus taichungensis]
MLNTIGQRVRFLRVKDSKTVENLVDDLDIPIYSEQGEIIGYKKVTKGTIGNLENDRNRPNLDLVTAISDYFGVSLDWIVKGKEHEGRKLSDPTREEVRHVLDSTKEEIIQELQETIRKIRGEL